MIEKIIAEIFDMEKKPTSFAAPKNENGNATKF
jgi:hypothetical protein